MGLLAGPLLLASCKKDGDDSKLEGPIPTSTFSFQANTTEYPVVVTFTATSQDGFIYEWNFGDNSVGTGSPVQHTYSRGGSYQVELLTAGRGGTGISAKQTVKVPDGCENAVFSKLVDCAGSGTRVWAFAGTPGAIVRESASGTVLSTSTTLNSCQLDDQFAFSSNYTLGYNSGGHV